MSQKKNIPITRIFTEDASVFDVISSEKIIIPLKFHSAKLLQQIQEAKTPELDYDFVSESRFMAGKSALLPYEDISSFVLRFPFRITWTDVPNYYWFSAPIVLIENTHLALDVTAGELEVFTPLLHFASLSLAAQNNQEIICKYAEWWDKQCPQGLNI